MARPYNAADPQQIAKAQKVTDQQRQDFDVALRWVLADERGRRVLWQLLLDGRLFEQSYLGDAEAAVFNEGRRSLGLQWWDRVERADPGYCIRMMIENLKEPADDGTDPDDPDRDADDSDA
jgi:hypothetical protein